MRKTFVLVLLVMVGLAVLRTDAFAVPLLQLYIEGATYDATETWVTDHTNFVLWAMGDGNGAEEDVVNGGTKYPLEGIQLIAAYDKDETGTVTLTPTTASDAWLISPWDTTVPAAPALVTSTGTGDPPYGKNWPAHDIYGTDTWWFQWSLGDFTDTDTPIGDFSGSAPPASFPDLGQINAYMVSVTGFTSVHFDLFGYYTKNTTAHWVKAPFSHDAEDNPDGPSPIPEPTSMLLLASGLLGLVAFRRKRA